MISDAITDNVNQLIQRPTERNGRSRVLATSFVPDRTPVQHQHGSQPAGIILSCTFMDSFLRKGVVRRGIGAI